MPTTIFHYTDLLILIIVIPCTLISCKEQHQHKVVAKPWTEGEKRKFYTDSVFYSENNSKPWQRPPVDFDSFMSRYYPDLKAKNKEDVDIYAMEEPYIDTTQIDATKHWLRIKVNPCFDQPYCFVIEKKNEKSILTTKITDGMGCYYPGILIATTRLQFADTLYDSIAHQLSNLKFWDLGIDTSCHRGFDGETWTFESIEKGKYNIINRWVPQHCGNFTTIQLAEIGVKLGQLSKIDDTLKALGGRKTGLE